MGSVRLPAAVWTSVFFGVGALLVRTASVHAVDDFTGYTPETHDLYSSWQSAGGPVVRNGSPSFVGNGLDFTGVGYGLVSEVISRAFVSPVHVASAQHTTTFSNPFYVAPAAGGTPLLLSGGNTTALGLGYDLNIGAMTAAHLAPNSGVTSYAILDLASASNYVGRAVFEVGHGNSDPGLSPRLAPTTITGASGQTLTTARPPAPVQGGDSGGPTMTTWTNPLGAQELVFLGTHYGTDFSGNTSNFNNFYGNTTAINAANATMINQGFAVRLAGVASTAWTGSASSDFATAGNWSIAAPASTNYVAFNGGAVAQRSIALGGASPALRGLQFGQGSAAEGFTFSNGTVQVGRGGIVNYSSAAQTFDSSVGITLTDHQYWDAVNGGLQVAGAVNLNGKLLVVQGNQNTTLSGVVSDSAGAASVGLTKYGTGRLVLSQPATYAGRTWIYGGALAFAADGALPASTALSLANNNTARLELGGRTLTVSSLSSVTGQPAQQGTIDLGTAGRLALDQAVNVDAVYSGAITGGSTVATSVILRGPTGTNIEFNLSGASAFSGQTRIERGNVHIGHANALGAAGLGNETIIATDDTTAPAVRLTAQGTMGETLVLLNSSTATTGTLGSTVTLTSPNLTLTGPMVLARAASVAGRGTAWTLQSLNSVGVVADVKFGEITGRLESGAAAGASTLTFNLYQNSQFSLDGAISNGTLSTLGVLLRGDGTIRVNAANAYTGTTSVQGKNTIVGVNALAGQNGAFGNASTAVNVGNLSYTFVSSLYAADGVQIGRNLAVSATNLTGVRVGALDNSTATYSGTVALSRPETSFYAGVGSVVTFSNNVTNGSGTPKVLKQGDGTVILSGTNSYTGGTTVEAGRLRALSAAALGTTGTVQVSGGVLEIASGVALSNANVQLAGGRLEVYGAISGLDFQSGTLAGTGAVNASVVLNSAGQILSPGQNTGSGSVPGGIAMAGNQTWSAFTYDWQVNDLDAAADAAVSADRVNIAGALSLGGAYTLRIASLTPISSAGPVENYAGGSRLWTVLSATGGISGFNPASWTLDTTQFALASGDTGNFSLYQDGNALVLSFTAIPEPSALALSAAGLTLLLGRRSRRGR